MGKKKKKACCGNDRFEPPGPGCVMLFNHWLMDGWTWRNVDGQWVAKQTKEARSEFTKQVTS